jgi:hypothetical protein
LSDSKALETEVVCLVEQRRLVEYFEYGVYWSDWGVHMQHEPHFGKDQLLVFN